MPRIDTRGTGHPPTRDLRNLLRAAFTPDDLYLFCEKHPPFQPCLSRFGADRRLEDMIQVVLAFTANQLYWEELLDGIAEHAPHEYNRTASQMGWPLVEEPPAVDALADADGANVAAQAPEQIGGARAEKTLQASASPSRLGLYLKNLPAELAEFFQAELGPFQSNIEATIQPYVEIGARPEDRLFLWHSKYGGRPYLPQGTPYPTSPEGRPLSLLAQINFAQVPSLEPFPREGILQFYIADDGLYGVNYHDLMAQEGFRVLYFPQVLEDEQELVTDWSFLPGRADFPFSEPRSLTFTRRYAPISGTDYRFESTVFGQDIPQPEEKLQEVQRIYERIMSAYGDKIGGYPCFRQWDPRGKKANREYEILLLQLFSGPWSSDHGALSFFIREKDLRARDFSRVMYYWDVD